MAREMACPSRIDVQETADLTKLEGWRTYESSVLSKHTFFDVIFSEGPPEKMVFRTPSKTTSSKLKKLEVYDFSGATDDLWLSCIYRDTAISLTQKMPEKISRCEVLYNPKTGFRSVERIECF